MNPKSELRNRLFLFSDHFPLTHRGHLAFLKFGYFPYKQSPIRNPKSEITYMPQTIFRYISGSVSPSVEKSRMRESEFISRSFFKGSSSGRFNKLISSPRVTAPDSPDITRSSPARGFPSARIPVMVTPSGQATKTSAKSRSISQDILLGFPQASPAMMVFKSPATV